MNKRAIHRQRGKINNVSTFGWHTTKLKWCMFTAHDIDFHDETEAKLAANDTLFTATPIEENLMINENVIKKDRKQKDIPASLNEIKLVDPDFVIQNWQYSVLRNCDFMHKFQSSRTMVNIMNTENKRLQETVTRLQNTIQVFIDLCYLLSVLFCDAVIFVLSLRSLILSYICVCF